MSNKNVNYQKNILDLELTLSCIICTYNNKKGEHNE